MKRFLCAILALLFFSTFCLAVEEEKKKEEIMDLGLPVVIVDGKMMVPLELGKWMAEPGTSYNIICDPKTMIEVRALKEETYKDKNGKKRFRVIDVPLWLAPITDLCKMFDYTATYRNGEVIIANEKKRGVLKPVPYIDLVFPSFRGTGMYGDFRFPISGGRKKYPVPEGWFWVYVKHVDHVSSQWPKPDGGAKMPYSLFFYRGSAIHVGSLKAPSHACVHVTKKDAKKLFEQVPLYTLVRVRKTGKKA